jgi:hypothetical protein
MNLIQAPCDAWVGGARTLLPFPEPSRSPAVKPQPRRGPRSHEPPADRRRPALAICACRGTADVQLTGAAARARFGASNGAARSPGGKNANEQSMGHGGSSIPGSGLDGPNCPPQYFFGVGLCTIPSVTRPAKTSWLSWKVAIVGSDEPIYLIYSITSSVRPSRRRRGERQA